MTSSKLNDYHVILHPNNQPDIDVGIITAKNEGDLASVVKRKCHASKGDYSFTLIGKTESDITNYKPPTWDVLFMRKVYEIASKSKDPRTKMGAVLVQDNHAILEGYNGFAKGVTDSEDRYNDKEIKYKFVVHAEANSVLIAARFGISTLGCTLYTQGIPCNECTKSVIQAGVSEIVVHKQWPNLVTSPKWVESIKISNIMLEEADVKVRVLNKKLNVKGYLDGKVLKV